MTAAPASPSAPGQRASRLFAPKRALARAIGALSRRSGRGGGTTLPGRALLRLAPDAIPRLAAGLDRGSIVVSATNGKTTTAGMIAAIMQAAGHQPIHNRAGSNMSWGVATALLEQEGDEGLFELDEAWLPPVAPQLRPRLLVLGNLFRDQLDRYGELERLADRWQELVASLQGRCEFALCADDPLIADLGRDRELRRRPGVIYFGIEDTSQALPELQHAHDAKHCRRCGAPYVYDRAFVGHLGHYTCPNCDADRPRPDVAATKIDLHGISGSRVHITTPQGELDLDLPLPGLYNVYNALAAVTAGLRSGISLEHIRQGLQSMRAVFGRVETIEVADKPVSILLIKNPAGANEVLRTLRLESTNGGIDLWLALNDRIADGRDVSWIWDADFELLADRVRRVVCAGTRAPEMALRLKYAGWPQDSIEVIAPIERSLDEAVSGTPERLFALPTYTALLELRTLLAHRGLAADYWR
ncbi:MAG TPA: MurT ligase domain-containing protein [Solirubrobacterales bacterium]|nr:MurT ligase domain-containing protein [Solirubrobacterales bacterium]